MSAFEVFFKIDGSKYGEGILLEKYGDKYSVNQAQESRNGGTIYKRWAFPQDKDKKPRDKAIPLGCQLGNRIEAIEILRKALTALEGDRQ